MRGTRKVSRADYDSRRFIPAHAGNAAARACRARQTSVHPRACGERFLGRDFWMVTIGSSPRMRGTQLAPGRFALSERFIPAHAGNACGVQPGLLQTPVHPRACGEREPDADLEHDHAGSSPRMRGTRRTGGSLVAQRRFIPAHAGNAEAATPSTINAPVHPRACGERMPKLLNVPDVLGSSPRMRGTRVGRNPGRSCRRFIPAHAGNAGW